MEQAMVSTDVKQEPAGDHELITRLCCLFEKEKLFLKETISLQMLAQQLGTNRSYLSKAMNQAFGQNFNAYINHLRIREAIEQIMQKPEGKINITDMALAIGFRNRNPFIDAFKKQTGVTPSVFISNYQKIINDTTQPSQNKIGN